MNNRIQILTLMNQGMELYNSWNTLHIRKSPESAEVPDVPEHEDDMTSLPTVPNEEPIHSQQRVLGALEQVSQMLQHILQNEELSAQLDDEEMAKLRLVAEWINAGPATPLSELVRHGGPVHKLLKAMDSDISVKARIKGPRGHLILKDAYSDFWDLPGGHVEDGERLMDGLTREVMEETGLKVNKAQQIYVKMLKLGGKVKPVVIYNAVCDGDIKLSEEHDGYMWMKDHDVNTMNLGVFKQFFVTGNPVSEEMGSSVTSEPETITAPTVDRQNRYSIERSIPTHIVAKGEDVNRILKVLEAPEYTHKRVRSYADDPEASYYKTVPIVKAESTLSVFSPAINEPEVDKAAIDSYMDQRQHKAEDDELDKSLKEPDDKAWDSQDDSTSYGDNYTAPEDRFGDTIGEVAKLLKEMEVDFKSDMDLDECTCGEPNCKECMDKADTGMAGSSMAFEPMPY